MLQRWLAALVVLGGLAIAPLHAEDLILIDGRYLQVEIQESSEEGLTVKLLRTGGVIFIPWSQLHPPQRDALMVRLGLKEAELSEPVIRGVRVVLANGEYFGVLLTEIGEDGKLPAEIVVHSDGRRVPLPSAQVRKIVPTEILARQAYSREQLYEQRLASDPLPEGDIGAQEDMVRFCASIGHHARAIEHLLKIRALDEQYRIDWIANQVARSEELVANEMVSEQIATLARLAVVRKFDEAMAGLERLSADQTLPPTLRQEAALKFERVQRKRKDYLLVEVRRAYFRAMEKEASRIAGDKKTTLRQAQSEARSKMHKAIIARVAERLNTPRQAIDKKEVEELFKERKVNVSRVANFGPGSFVVLGEAPGRREREQRIQRAMAQAAAEARRSGRGGGGGGMSLPQPQKPDEWYKKAATSVRSRWIQAYFAENGGQLAVSGERKYECSRCTGKKTIPVPGGQGQTIPVTCPRCAGHGYDKGVVYK